MMTVFYFLLFRKWKIETKYKTEYICGKSCNRFDKENRNAMQVNMNWEKSKTKQNNSMRFKCT